MKLESQVCSLEWSKKLKELGVKQNSWFYFVKSIMVKDLIKIQDKVYIEAFKKSELIICSAFSVAEIGCLFPSYAETKPDTAEGVAYITTQRHGGHFVCFFVGRREIVSFQAQTEADARAAMLCHLIENNIITVQEVNERVSR